MIRAPSRISKATLLELVREINQRMHVNNAIPLGTLSRPKTVDPAPAKHRVNAHASIAAVRMNGSKVEQ